jgi:hexosaminidase
VSIYANTRHGIFNGVQTFRQLLVRDGAIVDGCDIKDWPAYSIRGFMVDVGRNYQSMNLLKQQIDMMAKYKLNFFHFHFTEDIAWRLAIKQYPQLTSAENMLRDKGMYYTEDELKELIAYCKERYITLVPEIDMPGHSAAFTRAMKTDMQSDSGLVMIKNILSEFCNTYDVPYIHIGGDEVKISNKNFLPEVTKLIHSFGNKTIGWSPGGNIGNQTIRQLWMGDQVEDTTLPYIDSRHLYINHMDPLESVVTIFNRQIGSKTKGDDLVKGGILCLWHDRRVAKEDDVLRMNPVYPAMLAFAERSWRGGGYKGWIANISTTDTMQLKAFKDFEQRMLNHKQQYFSTLPFPYVAQTQMRWNLYGPYSNNGDVSKVFEPETKSFDSGKTPPALQAIGGTIVLRHWWHPLIKGVINQPKENTTWYASTKIWSDENAIKDFWIGFNNLSRSPATNTPAQGTWSDYKSEVWVNGNIITPPNWKRGGQRGNAEIPLIDEGYEYRQPTQILLKKGWNTVLIKAPVRTFKGSDWQNPVKWMFTFVPL